MAPLMRRLAPATSRHPGIWDLANRILPGGPAETLLQRSIRPFADLDLTLGGEESSTAFGLYERTELVESVHASRYPSVLLPSGGWGITGGIALEEHGVIDFGEYRDLRPGFRRNVAVNALRQVRAPSLETAMSLRTFGETNHFHLVNDLIGGRLRLFEESGAPAHTPIVISRALADFGPFRELRALPAVEGRQWVVQEPGTMLRCRHLLVARTTAFSRANVEYARSTLGVPSSRASDTDRIFVDRRSRGMRDVANREDLEEVCRRFGFSIIDPAGMPLSEQMERFSRAAFVVGVHGAGLTNIIFRRDAPLHLLEIFPGPPGPQAAQYFFVCRTTGFGYSTVSGDSGEAYPWSGGFTLDPHRLETAIEAMLSAATA